MNIVDGQKISPEAITAIKAGQKVAAIKAQRRYAADIGQEAGLKEVKELIERVQAIGVENIHMASFEHYLALYVAAGLYAKDAIEQADIIVEEITMRAELNNL